jgi:hypothetical protein
LLMAWFLILVVTLLPSWSGNGNNSRRTTINLGVGHRLLVEDDMAIAGINFFTDYESKSKHKRLSPLMSGPSLASQ